MTLRSILAGTLALVLSASFAVAQPSPGSSPLTPAKGGTNSAFVGFAGPASTVKTFTLPNASDTIATLAATQTLTNKTLTSPTLTAPVLGIATATSINKVAITAPASSATLTIPDGVTLTGPASSGTAMTLGNTETITGIKTFGSAGAVGRLKVAGTTSGTTVLDATAVASGTLTLPAATDTLIGKATTDTLTNKTYDTAGAGNSFSINGVAATANTGTGAVARAAAPTFTAPVLGVASATSMAIGSTNLNSYIARVQGGNANQMVLDNTGEEFTELDYANNGTVKALTFYDSAGGSSAFHFRVIAAGGGIVFETNGGNNRMQVYQSGGVVMGVTTDPGAPGNLAILGGFQSAPPTTKTTAYSQLTTDSSLIFNGGASITLTLLAAATYPGKEIVLKNIAAFTVISASSNVVPLAGGAAGTAILAATAGKWAKLKSDGTNWQIMESN